MSGSIALVVLDSVRKDYFDEYFDWLPGIWFDHAWSTGNYSIPAHGSLFGGRYPSELGVHAKSQSLDCPESVLPELLGDAGYRTRAYSANELIGPDYGFDRGFDEFNLRWDLSGTFSHLFPWRSELTADAGPRDYAEAVFKCLIDGNSKTFASLRQALQVYAYEDDGIMEVLEFVSSIDFEAREFLFLNLMEAHWPYWGAGDHLSYDSNPLDEPSETIPGGDVDLSSQERGYGDCVRYLASKYRRLYELLSESFDYVITLADHGDLFGEHGAKAHFYGLYEDLTRVPVVISDGRDGRARRPDVVSLVDVYATICGIAGVDAGRRGVDLREGDQTDPRLLEFHGFDEHRRERLISRGFDNEEIDEYDRYLAGIVMEADYYGHETPDGFIERGTAHGDPRQELDRLLDRLDRSDSSGKSATVSEETIQRLRDFGYL